MKNRLLPLINKLWLRKKTRIEMINNHLKNLTKILHFRHRSVGTFLVSFIVGLIACTSIALHVAPSGAATTRPYTNPAEFTSIPFGAHSHWLQPWRAYLETVPATRFLNGTGIQWNVSNSANPQLVAAMLARHGIRRARIEVGWGDIDFYDESRLIPRKGNELRAKLLAFKRYGIRPLILLNANHGIPVPMSVFERTVVQNARAGDTTLKLNSVVGLDGGYSGISNLTEYWAAESLVTDIDDATNTITLSKSLPINIEAGTAISMVNLQYRPFEPPTTNNYQVTMAGWKRYVGTVARIVTGVLETTQSSDKGFDMEIWNELTFGSHFLFINDYYGYERFEYDEESIFDNLVRETATYVDAHSADFQGVRLGNGFANTIPWPASSEQPRRIHAIDKHPYATRKNYPQNERQDIRINALGQEDTSSFVPTYSALFPEYYGTALQTETLVRDMGPITSEIYDTNHGRNARVINGEVIQTPVWITEVNISPQEDDANVTWSRANRIKAKTTARYFSFYLNKGASQLYLYAAAGGIRDFGIVTQDFLDYAEQPNAVYPTDDTAYTSAALAVLDRIVDKMSQQVDQNLRNTRSLEVVSVSDTHNHYQFAGDGTAAHPNLYDRDVFAFLPFQVNAKRFVIPYYVMTRDVVKDLAPEQFTVQINGVRGSGASVTAYDPLNNRTVPVVVNSRGQNSLSIKVTATDYPYLLTVQEAQ